jgi:hypothetical protein
MDWNAKRREGYLNPPSTVQLKTSIIMTQRQQPVRTPANAGALSTMSKPDFNRGGLFRLSRLGWEIVIILAVKFFILYFIWLAWFARPEVQHMRLPDGRLEQRLLTRAGSPSSAPISAPSATGVRDAPH